MQIFKEKYSFRICIGTHRGCQLWMLCFIASCFILNASASKTAWHRTSCPQDSLEIGGQANLASIENRGQSKLYHTKPEIKIGFLGTFHSGRMIGKLVVGAMPLAVHRVNKDESILPNHRLTFVAENVGMPDTSGGVKKMTELKDHAVKAFIGPDESCYAEALVADAWNVPMITYMCYDQRVSKGEVFRTFARTLPSSSKVSKSVISLLKHFSWHRIGLVVSELNSYMQTKEVLTDLAKKHNITVANTYTVPADYMEKHNHTLYKIIEDSYKTTRIYILLTDTHVLIDFVGVMHKKGLLNSGEYVIISVEEDEIYNPQLEYQFMLKEWDRYKPYRHFDATPFRSVLMITPCAPDLESYQKFQEEVQRHAALPPLCIPFHPQVQVEIPPYAGMAYDAVFLYARAATEVLRRNGSLDDGAAIIAQVRNKAYRSVLGFDIKVDENGEAEGNYTVLGFANATDEHLSPIGRFTLSENGSLPIFQLETEVAWLGAGPPESEPKCGFYKEKCISKQDWRTLVVMSSCASFILIALGVAIRHYRYEYKLAKLLWKVDIRDVLTIRAQQGSTTSLQNIKVNISSGGFASTPSHYDLIEVEDYGHISSSIGFYKGNIVFIKPVFKKSIDLTRSIRKELIQIREMRHENINPFIGACVDPPNICILSVYSARGSLEDVLKNQDLNLDGMFVSSLVSDLIKGMIYIHDSEIVSHGNLKPSNCLVDSRWVLQITDFGLHEFRSSQNIPNSPRTNRADLWKAPELLRHPNPPPRGTQKGDIYSFSIILYEIIGRNGPWGPDALPTKCIIEKVAHPSDPLTPYRPPIDSLVCADYVIQCLNECWDENPDSRPDFRFVNVRLREMQSGLKPNIFDNMIAIMEKYAYNLESLVQERTTQLMEEKKKTENLLLRMLPKPVAEQLKRGEPVEAESFDSVTIYFSDIVGFTELSAKSSPLQVVNLLNNLYTCFDSIIGNYDVYKVETIGDAYMVVSGLPIKTHDHAAQVASMALHLLAAIANFEIPHRPGERLKLRIGVHTGPCVAGVVGLKMPRYCLFGDTVNTASRMESTGEALRIHISEACKRQLDKWGGFNVEERGMTMIKGKGEMRTYWLQGKRDDQPPPVHVRTPSPTSAPPVIPHYPSFSQFLRPTPVSNFRSNSLTSNWSSTPFRYQGRTCSTGGGRLPFLRGFDG